MHIVAQYVDIKRTMKAEFIAAGMKSFHNRSRGKTSVELPSNDEGVYDFSKLPPGQEILLVLSEFGFGRTDISQSRGVVIGGIYGDPIRPHYVVPPSESIHHNHVIFYLYEVGLRFRATGNGKASIEECELLVEAQTARIEVRPIWEGRVGRLPSHLDCYDKAIWAAWEKAMCYHCSRPHYIRGCEHLVCPNASVIRQIQRLR